MASIAASPPLPKSDSSKPNVDVSRSHSHENRDYWQRTGKQLAASTLAGWTDATVTYPTEYTKVMLQLQEGKGKEKQFFSGPIDVVRQTLRRHGPLGMYRGVSVVYVGNVPKYMFRFGTFEQLKPFLVDANGHLSSYNKLLCGLGAGIAEALFAVVPQDSIKMKFIHDRCSPTPRYRGLFDGARQIVRERGLGAMYTGVWPTVLKQSSNQAIRFFVFESLKDWSTRGNGGQGPNGALVPLFGAIAGAASVAFNTPLDVIKTRLQGLNSDKYKGTLDCIRQMYRKEGFTSFYKGSSMRLLKVSMEVAIAFTCYTFFLDLFGVTNNNNNNSK